MTPLKIEPILNKNGAIELYDIYDGNKFIGSRRSLEQCKEIETPPEVIIEEVTCDQFTKDFTLKAFKFITNEIEPRSKKLNLSSEEFLDPLVTRILVQCELEGLLTRKITRQILDKCTGYHNER